MGEWDRRAGRPDGEGGLCQGGSTMTVVGKVLAFFVLVFSVLTGALVVMLYISSTNYSDAYAKLKVQYDALKADRDQTFTESGTVKKDSSQQVGDLKGE